MKRRPNSFFHYQSTQDTDPFPSPVPLDLSIFLSPPPFEKSVFFYFFFIFFSMYFSLILSSLLGLSRIDTRFASMQKPIFFFFLELYLTTLLSLAWRPSRTPHPLRPDSSTYRHASPMRLIYLLTPLPRIDTVEGRDPIASRRFIPQKR